MNKIKKKINIRVVYIYDFKIQLLTKKNICNLQELIVPLFVEATTESEGRAVATLFIYIL